MFGKVTMFISCLGTFMAMAVGGWNTELTTLLIFMIIDYAMGIVVGMAGKSPKTETGGISSRYGWIGACKKVLSLVMVMIAHRIDLIVGGDWFKLAVTTGFLLNELVSIVENAGILGIPLPPVVNQMIDVLKQKDSSQSGKAIKKYNRRDDDGTMV